MGNSSTNITPSRKDWFILSFLSLIWGSSFILIKYSLNYFTPLQVGTMRILISSIAFLPIFLVSLSKLNWSKWPYLLIVGLCGSGIPAFLFPLAQMKLSSSLSGILNTLTPLFTLIIGYLIFKTTISKQKIAGVIIGLVGACILILLGEKIQFDSNLKYGLYILGATICYGTSVNVIANKLKTENSTLVSAASFSFLLPLGIIMFFQMGLVETFRTTENIWTGLGYVALLSIFGTFLASLLFYKMVQRTNAVFGSSVTYLIPIVSTIWGIADGELFSVFHAVGAAFILFGVFLSRKG